MLQAKPESRNFVFNLQLRSYVPRLTPCITKVQEGWHAAVLLWANLANLGIQYSETDTHQL